MRVSLSEPVARIASPWLPRKGAEVSILDVHMGIREAGGDEQLDEPVLRLARMGVEAESDGATDLHDAPGLSQAGDRIGPDLQRVDRQRLLERLVVER